MNEVERFQNATGDTERAFVAVTSNLRDGARVYDYLYYPAVRSMLHTLYLAGCLTRRTETVGYSYTWTK